MLVLTIIVNTNIFSQPMLFGMTSKGGDGAGVIFSMSPGASMHSFQYNMPIINPGDYPKGLIEARNGKLYGTTMFGGAFGFGILFEYDRATNTYTKKFDFNGSANGKNPSGSLIQAENGMLYGMTSAGGAFDYGVIFEYDITYDICTKKMDFNGKVNGAKPFSTFMLASNGRFYGTTSSGGEYDDGVLFEYSYSSNSYLKKIDFIANSKGAYPNGTLVEGAQGKLYGMAAEGGAFNKGLIYEYDFITNICTKKMDFNGVNGRNPYNNSLMKASDSKLFGMTTTGGINDLGVLFEYDIASNAFSKKIDFGGSNYGATPIGTVIKASDGKLYGANVSGGVHGFGVLFEYDMEAGTFIKKLDFFAISGGADPANLLMEASDKKIYGLTNYGGTFNKGVLFEYDLDNSFYTKKLDLIDKSNGADPKGSLMLASNGYLYGLTSQGGLSGKGVLFEYDVIKHIYTKKFSFDGEGTGANPNGNLIQAANGKLYGFASQGGSYSGGVLFEYDTETNVLSKKVDFDGANNGKKPNGSLIEAPNGMLYGMTNSGGINNVGVLFEYDYGNDTYTKKIDFSGITNGSNPFGSLIYSHTGKLYGLTSAGGMHQFGVLFEYDFKSNTLVKRVDFNGTINGRYPMGDLVQANNGRLYGMTSEGGENNLGVIFEYDQKENLITKKFDFSLENGSNPRGSLMHASNGKLYGMTSLGGANNLGVIFEYDVLTNTYTKKMDFDAEHGANPIFGNIIEVLGVTGLETAQTTEGSLLIFPNPTLDLITIKSENPVENLLVVNSLGQIIIQKNNSGNKVDIDLRGYPEGVYYLRLKQVNGIINKRIVKH